MLVRVMSTHSTAGISISDHFKKKKKKEKKKKKKKKKSLLPQYLPLNMHGYIHVCYMHGYMNDFIHLYP